MENNQSSFWQFSDQLRVQTNTLTNLSLNDSIWSNSYVSKRPENRRNFDLKVGGEINPTNSFSNNIKSDLSSEINNSFSNNLKSDLGFSNDDAWKDVNNSGFKSNLDGFSNSGFKSDFNSFKSNFDGFNNSGFKSDFNGFKSNFDGFSNSGFNTEFDGFSNDAGYRSFGSSKNVADVGGMGLNGGFNKGVYSNAAAGMNFGYDKGINNVVVNGKPFHSKGAKGNEIYEHGGVVGVGGKNGKKNKNNKENNKEGNGENKNALDKRFKTLPPAESLPRNETVGGYIFVCNNDTMQENLKRQLFGLPPRYRDSVRAITPGLPVFLYNYSTHQLHGIFEAASFGGTNIDPTAWEDKKNPGESRFPAQVAVVNRKACEPLEEDSFRPILHHYDGPKFRLELNVPEALSLLDVFYENNP